MGNPQKVFYRKLYQLLERETPLKFDCGRLCGAACCQTSPELPGTYLSPGEEAMFDGLDGFTMTDAELPGYGTVRLLSCEGSCDRAVRPLSCRVFPLAPAVSPEGVGIRLDPRGRAACPLCRQSAGALSGSFAAAVRQVFASLWDELECRRFLAALSHHLDEFGQPL